MILWSILIPMIPQRLASAHSTVLGNITQQAHQQAVEVIGLYDNQKMTVGQKRNALIAIARGQYISFVDDDDKVHPTYVSSILTAITNNLGVDLISFPQRRFINGRPAQLCYHSAKYATVKQTPTAVWGPPTHLLVWRRALIQDIKFPEMSFGEDRPWWAAAAAKVRTEVELETVLYEYYFSARTSATNSFSRQGG